MDLRTRVARALDEDIGPGDLTTDGIVPPGRVGRAIVVAKEPLVVSGQSFARVVFEVVGQRFGTVVAWREEVPDGSVAENGQTIASITGDLRALIIGERLALNLMMRSCGIASHVRRWLQDIGPATFRAVDTRKTTPLWRDLEKAAVRHGGGHNHRLGLFDGVLIKDNHIAACGGVAEAVARARAHVHHLVRIQVEVTDLDQLDVAMAAGCDGVLLDNMSDEMLAAAVARVQSVRPEVFTEASGNMNPERMKRIAQTGLDVVSVGGFIHQARWADLSLRVLS